MGEKSGCETQTLAGRGGEENGEGSGGSEGSGGKKKRTVREGRGGKGGRGGRGQEGRGKDGTERSEARGDMTAIQTRAGRGGKRVRLVAAPEDMAGGVRGGNGRLQSRVCAVVRVGVCSLLQQLRGSCNVVRLSSQHKIVRGEVAYAPVMAVTPGVGVGEVLEEKELEMRAVGGNVGGVVAAHVGQGRVGACVEQQLARRQVALHSCVVQRSHEVAVVCKYVGVGLKEGG